MKLRKTRHAATRPPKRHAPRRPWRRALLTALALPPLLMACFGLTTAYRIYASNRLERRLPLMPVPRQGRRILVFAPHCDDEALGAAGLMRQARRAGSDVHVVVITNGDGFRVGVQREFRELSVPPKDFVRYALRRQDESRAAMKVLGVPRDCVTFLGYPDRGLLPMWKTNWSPQAPFFSTYTQTSRSPYPNSPTPGAAYCGQSLLADIERQMRATQPTDVFVTHPNDDHPDHSTASVFVQTALADLRAQGVPWARAARLHFYLVHRGDWPVPQGLYESASLPPPAQMASLDTRWEELPLSPSDVHAKYAAIKRYPSQTEVSSRFLFSFARRNELFGTLGDGTTPTLARVPDGRIRLDGDAGEWAGQAPIALDPAGDSVLRAFQGSADVTRVFACRDSGLLYVRLDAHQRLSPRVSYLVTLRPVAAGPAQPPCLTLAVTPSREGRAQPIPGVSSAMSAWHGNSLELSVPLSQVGLGGPGAHETLYVAAETRFADLPIDKTGFRGVACAPAPALRTAAR